MFLPNYSKLLYTQGLFTCNVTVSVKVSSKFNIVSVVTETLTGKMDFTPILSVAVSFKTVTLTAGVNKALISLFY